MTIMSLGRELAARSGAANGVHLRAFVGQSVANEGGCGHREYGPDGRRRVLVRRPGTAGTSAAPGMGSLTGAEAVALASLEVAGGGTLDPGDLGLGDLAH